MSVSLDKIKETNEHQMVSMTAQLLMMESRINKMKKMAHMESDLRKNKVEFDNLCKQIQQAQQKLKLKKRQIIQQKLTKIHSRQEERQQRNKQSNHILAKIKQGHRQRRKRMESLVNEYKRQYDQMYQKKLLQRRQETRLNLQDIHQHQKQYLRSLRKHSNRIKTESLQKSRYRYAMEQQSFELSMKAEKQENSLMRDKIMELVNKRIEYGNKAERQSIKIKIPQGLLQKLKADSNKSGYDKNIDAYNMEKQRYKKAKLDTNFTGDIQETRVKQINRLATQQASPPTEKLKRLRNIVDGYNLQYVNGQVEALDMMCSASIARANLLLKQV